MLSEFEPKKLRHRLERTCSRCDRCFDTIVDMYITDGIDGEEKIVQVMFDEQNEQLLFWCNEHKVKKQEIVLKRMGDEW